MALSPPSYSPQPFTAFVKFWIGDASQPITLYDDMSRPRSLQAFTVTRGAQSVGDFTLTVVDPTWTEIQDAIFENFQCRFQYGYEGGVQSPMFEGLIRSATPSFTIDAMQLEIEGSLLPGIFTQIRKSRAHPDTRPQADGTPLETYDRISEYVRRILKRDFPEVPDANIEVVKTKRLLRPELPVDDQHLVDKAYIQQRQTDIMFIRNTLAKEALSEEREEGGYVFLYNIDYPRKGLNFYFGPPKFADPPKRLFVYMRQPDSEVISFETDNNTGWMLGLRGGVRSAIPWVDIYNRKFGYKTGSNKDTPKKARLATSVSGGVKDEGVVNTRENHPHFNTLPADTEQIADVMAKIAYFREAWGAVTGKLVIMGDYKDNIQPLSTISVLVTTPPEYGSQIHYTSGNYKIMNVTDEIVAGSWQTTLDLVRDGTLRGKEDIQHSVDNSKMLKATAGMATFGGGEGQ